MPSRYRFAMASALPLLGLSLLQPTPVAAQSAGPICEVSRLVLEVTTGGDDLRGGQNNLNVEIHLLNGEVRTFANVNHSANWGNNSRHQVELNLVRPTASTEISYVRLIHLAQGSLEISPSTVASPVGVAAGLKTQDNWDMARLEVIVTDGGREERVGEAGPYRFTGDNTQLSVHLRFPPNACSSAQVPIQGRRPGAGAMTNQDVIRMTKAGVPESAIIAAIKRARPGGFDFAPAAQQELNQAGVSPALLRAMHEHGTPNADDLNPQPYPPKGTGSRILSASPGRNMTVPANLHILAGPEVRNPAAQVSPVGARPLPIAGPVVAARPRGRFALAPATRVCTGPPSIAAVEANPRPSAAGVEFTPDGSTDYVITGCGFGNAPGQVALSGNFAAPGGHVAMLPYHPLGAPGAPGWGSHWSDSRIEAMVDPNVSGELDIANVSLVVIPANGAPVQRANFAFRARRGSPVLLSNVPASAFCEQGTADARRCTTPGFVDLGTLHSPCGAWLRQACTVEVLRTPADAVFGDTFTLQLKPGFVVYSASILVGTPQGSEAGAAPTPVLRGNIITVQPPVTHLTADPKSETFSLYGLRIFVVGPVGVANAWSGQ